MKILSVLLLLAVSLYGQSSPPYAVLNDGVFRGTGTTITLPYYSLVTPADAWQTSLEAAKANTLASSTAMVQHFNLERTRIYNQNFEDWKTMVLAGKIGNYAPPQPPVAYEVVTAASGFAYPELGKDPVCEARRDIPPDYSKPNVSVLPEPDYIRNVPKGDVFPVGFVVTAPDGTKWQKQSSVTPFGVAYFYARIA